MRPWLVLLLAIAPGALAWWRGRALAAAPDETVAERLFAHRREVAAIGASAGALVVLLAGVHDGQILAYGPRLEPVLLRPREGALVRLRVDAVGMPALAPGGRVLGVLRDEGSGGTLAVFGLP